MSTPFLHDLALWQGRRPASPGLDGAWALQLGSEVRGEVRAALGDYASISQAVALDPSKSKLVRASFRIEGPDAMPSGWFWLLSGWVNGAKKFERSIRPGARRTLVLDAALPMVNESDAPTTNSVEFRLVLASGPGAGSGAFG